jgi:hypothetical protein
MPDTPPEPLPVRRGHKSPRPWSVSRVRWPVRRCRESQAYQDGLHGGGRRSVSYLAVSGRRRPGGFHAGDFTEPAFAVSLSDADREVVAEPTDTTWRHLREEITAGRRHCDDIPEPIRVVAAGLLRDAPADPTQNAAQVRPSGGPDSNGAFPTPSGLRRYPRLQPLSLPG